MFILSVPAIELSLRELFLMASQHMDAQLIAIKVIIKDNVKQQSMLV